MSEDDIVNVATPEEVAAVSLKAPDIVNVPSNFDPPFIA
jgi:hypothetical protein